MIKTKYLAVAVAAILVISGALTFIMLGAREAGAVAKIYVDGELWRAVPLKDVAEPYEFEVSTKYGVNTVRVEDGRIRVTDADCPDKICVGMGWRSTDAVPISCLPHRLVIEIEGAPDGVDAVAGVAP